MISSSSPSSAEFQRASAEDHTPGGEVAGVGKDQGAAIDGGSTGVGVGPAEVERASVALGQGGRSTESAASRDRVILGGVDGDASWGESAIERNRDRRVPGGCVIEDHEIAIRIDRWRASGILPVIGGVDVPEAIADPPRDGCWRRWDGHVVGFELGDAWGTTDGGGNPEPDLGGGARDRWSDEICPHGTAIKATRPRGGLGVPVFDGVAGDRRARLFAEAEFID